MRFRQRRRRVTLGFVALEERLVMAAPVLDPIANAAVPAGKTLMIPLTAADADGDSLTYTVSGDNGEILATVKAGQPFVKMTVAGYGDMIFQLFDDIAPVTVDKITGLIESGFYDGLKIHRIVPDFVIQGGDPNGDGSGGPGFKFDDEFSLEAIFSGVGQLAMANSGKDTNGSQFFVTQEPVRFLDFNHTIYGQLVRGFNVLTTLNGVSAPVTIDSVSVITNITDAVLQLKAPATGSTSFTVTVTDTNGDSDSETFTATASADTVNDPPILGPVTDKSTLAGKPIDIVLSSVDYENDPVIYEAAVVGTPANATAVVNGNVVTVTPKAGFTGTFDLRLSVRQVGATDRGSTQDPRDYQTIKVTVLNGFETQKFDISAKESTPVEQFVVVDFVPNLPVPGSVYTASIAWGDTTTSQGIITDAGSGHFKISGSHTYNRFGNYSVVVTIQDTFQNITQTVTANAVISDETISATWVEPALPGGIGIVSGVLAAVTDANPSGVISDLTAVIAWGDGSTSPGTITVGEDGRFLVSGTKSYLAVGEYDVKVTVTSLGGSTAEATGKVAIVNDPPVFAPVDDQYVDEGTALEFFVSATDPNAEQGQAVRYQLVGPVPQFVSIDSVTGKIRVAANARPGTYALLVRALDNGNPPNSAFLGIDVTVGNKPPLISLDGAIPASLESGASLALSGAIADLPESGPWNIEVDYGTGEGFVQAIYSTPTNFSIYRTYTNPGSYALKLRVSDASGAKAEIGSTIVVTDPPLVRPVRVVATRDRSARITSLQVFFDRSLDAASAKLPSNYAIFMRAGRDGVFGTADDAPMTRFRRVSYDAATNSVTLTPATPFALRGRALARVRITGLKDTRGRLIDGNRDGNPGGDLNIDLSPTTAAFA